MENMRWERLILATLMVITISCAFAKSLYGKIECETIGNIPSHEIMCVLQNTDSTILQTVKCGVEGRFRFDEVPQSAVYLLIQIPGANAVRMAVPFNNKDVDLGKIHVDAKSTSLQEIVVEGESSNFDVEKMTVIPSSFTLKSSNTVLAVLEQLYLPGLLVNTVLQTSSIYGKDVIYKVDGIKRPLSYVLTLNPSKILKIEYSTNTSIRDVTSNSGGVINIILKKKEGGVSHYQNLYSALTCKMINENIGLSFNYKKSEFNLSYGGQYRGYNKCFNDSYSLFIKENDTIVKTVRSNPGNLRMFLNDISLDYNYVPNSSFAFSVKAGNLFGPWKKTWDGMNEEFRHGIVNGNYTDNLINQPYFIPSLDVYVKKSSPKLGTIEYNNVTTYNRIRNDSWSNYQFADKEDVFYNNSVHGKKWSTINELLWIKRILNTEINIGCRDTYVRQSYTYINLDGGFSELTNNTLFFYAEAKGKLRKLNYTLGTGAYITNTFGNNFNRLSYFRNYSVARWLISPFHRMSINGALKFSPGFPSPGSIDDIFLIINNLSAVKGNPYLKPSNTLEGDININWGCKGVNLSYRCYYGHTWLPIFSNIKLWDGYFTSMSENGGRYNSFETGLNISYVHKFNQKLTLNISAYGAYGIHWFEEESSVEHRYGKPYFHGKFSLNYGFWTFGMSGSTKIKTLYGNIITVKGPESYGVVSYRWRNFNFSVMLSWIGWKHGDSKEYINISEINPSLTSTQIRNNANTVGLSITYRFNKGINTNNFNRNLNNKDRNSDTLREK